MGISADQIDQLKVKYQRVCVIAFRDDIEIVMRAPTRAEYKVCRAAMHTPGQMPEAQEDLIRKCVVACNGEMASEVTARTAFDALLDLYPGLCENKRAAKELSNFTGLEFAAQGKA